MILPLFLKKEFSYFHILRKYPSLFSGQKTEHIKRKDNYDIDDGDDMELDDYENIIEDIDVDSFNYLYSLFLILLAPIGFGGGYMIKRKKLSFRHVLTLLGKIRKVKNVKSVKRDSKKKVKSVNYKRRGTMESIIDETIEVINDKTIEDNSKKIVSSKDPPPPIPPRNTSRNRIDVQVDVLDNHHHRLIYSQKSPLTSTW